MVRTFAISSTLATKKWLCRFLRCAKLEINLHPKSRHDAGLNIFPGIE